MGFVYPRTVSISRPNATPTTQVGDVGYSAERGAIDETIIASDLPASIQIERIGQRNPAGLPTDAPSDPTWLCFIPKRAAALGTVQSADVVTDDLGIRYSVSAPYWDSLGYQLRMKVLEV